MQESVDLRDIDEELLALLDEGRLTAPFAAEQLPEYQQAYVGQRLRWLAKRGLAENLGRGLYDKPERAGEGDGDV